MTAAVIDAITKLRALTQVDVQNSWRYCTEDLPLSTATESECWQNWPIAEPNTKKYIVWSARRQVIWLAQTLIIPHDLQGYPLTGLSLRLSLVCWSIDIKIFVNGQLVQQGDLFDSSARVLLSNAVVPGEKITVALRLVSPGHDIGALMKSVCLYESTNDITPLNPPNPSHSPLQGERTEDEAFYLGGRNLTPSPPLSFSPKRGEDEGLNFLFRGGLGRGFEDLCKRYIDPSFIADELAILQQYAENFAPEKLEILINAVTKIDWEAVSQQEAFNLSLSNLRQNLQPFLEIAKQRRIQMLGHAHLDLAWLWTVSETWEVAQRTFESVLNLQQEFPKLTFCHSTPALYAWIEQHRPDLFTAIQQQITKNRWEVVGGMWVEPELNLINGESIVRQVLYAQRYVQEKFGQLTKVAWVPDSFGFCWQLPQILQQGGIEYFVTQKLHWNDTTKFPYGVFWWQSPDGTKIFSLMSPPNVTGVMDTNPITMTSYSVDWEIQTNLKNAFWLPGVGDHGGGPTRDMLQVAQRWQNSPFFPQLEFTTAHSYLSEIRGQLLFEQTEVNQQETNDKGQLTKDIPIWNDELYLEFHRGCYTTHADQKRWNRRCEDLLYQAELFASLATISAGTNYPKLQLEDSWKKVLFNQFHDILPGTSIPEVFVEANQAWEEVEAVGLAILNNALKAIASQITLPPPPKADAQPIIVFNSLNWSRCELVSVSLPLPNSPLTKEREAVSSNTLMESWEIYDFSGEKLSSQLIEESKLIFLAKDIPSIGYRLFWLCRGDEENPTTEVATRQTKSACADYNSTSLPNTGLDCVASPLRVWDTNWVLENEVLRVVVDPDTGDLSSVYDKVHQKEILNGPGNQLQAFQDSGQYWDAWNIDPNYKQHPLPPTQLKSIQWLETGPLRSRLQVVRQLGKSQFYQDYLLSCDSPTLQIVTTVDWQESHVLVKAAFPLTFEAKYAVNEIACGAIQRPTQPQTPAEQSKWEVSALRWADLGDEGYGVSLLNDCKYGYDYQPSELRLTLLRSPCWPDPDADRGIHQFTYALYPHSGNWQLAGTVRRGYELNLPLLVVNLPNQGENVRRSLPPVGRLLDLQAENLVLMAFKQSENSAQKWILRCYECHGDEAELSLASDLDLAIPSAGLHPIVFRVNLLEEPTQMENGQTCKLGPWKIANFTVIAAESQSSTDSTASRLL